MIFFSFYTFLMYVPFNPLLPASISLTPWSNAINTFSSNAGNISLWRSIRSVRCTWGDIDLCQLVQQFGGATLGNSGTTIDHKIIIQSISFSARLHRECDPGFALNILQFLVEIQVSTDNFIAAKANPNNRDLRTAILVQRHKMSKMARSQCLSDFIIQNHNYQILSCVMVVDSL